MSQVFKEELDFVGSAMGLPWFNRKLLKNETFTKLVDGIRSKNPKTSLRTILLSLPPLCEYVASVRKVVLDRVNGKKVWIELLEDNANWISTLATTHGRQENIPQRAAVLLDYFFKCNLFSKPSGLVVELGCSAGLLGTVLCSSEKLFVENNGAHAKQFFWLKKRPRLTQHTITYVGYDRVIPAQTLTPFYVWDKEKRAKVVAFSNTYPLQGVLHEEGFKSGLKSIPKSQQFVDFETIIILTSFVLGQLTEPEILMGKILKRIDSFVNVHWLDLSQNSQLDCMFGAYQTVKNLVPNHTYLSHNGVPVAHIVDGGDDCSDWEYI